MNNRLVKLLIAYQKQTGMTNKDMADMLNVGETMLFYIKSGERQMGMSTLQSIYWNFDGEIQAEAEELLFGRPTFNTNCLKQLDDLRGMRQIYGKDSNRT